MGGGGDVESESEGLWGWSLEERVFRVWLV